MTHHWKLYLDQGFKKRFMEGKEELMKNIKCELLDPNEKGR